MPGESPACVLFAIPSSRKRRDGRSRRTRESASWYPRMISAVRSEEWSSPMSNSKSTSPFASTDSIAAAMFRSSSRAGMRTEMPTGLCSRRVWAAGTRRDCGRTARLKSVPTLVKSTQETASLAGSVLGTKLLAAHLGPQASPPIVDTANAGLAGEHGSKGCSRAGDGQMSQGCHVLFQT